MYTNVKNLPADQTYFTSHGYSDSAVWVVVKRTAKTVTLAHVNCKRDPEFKPEFHVGSFLGHCSNQSDQTWLFDKIEPDYTITARLTKNGWRSKGTKLSEDRARRFYDYNF